MRVSFENRTPPHKKFYRLHLERELLFVSLERYWGRIGSRGRQKVEYFHDPKEAHKAYQALCRKRERHGYTTAREEAKKTARSQRSRRNNTLHPDPLPLFWRKQLDSAEASEE